MICYHTDPLVDANLRVAARNLPNAVVREEIAVVPEEEIRGELNIVIRISGESERDVIISMDTATAVRICSNLLSTEIDSLTSSALDAVAEFGNIIAGNAVSELNDRGFDFILNAPVVTVGGDSAVRKARDAVHLSLDSDWGKVSVNILPGDDLKELSS